MKNNFDDEYPTSSSTVSTNESTNPAEYLKMKPKKSILKSKQGSFEDLQKSFDHEPRATSEDSQKGAHFDEMNILATHHPPDKDYGHMKIDEPKTPYNAYSDSEEDSQASGPRPRRVSLVGPVDPAELNRGLSMNRTAPKCFEPGSGPEEDYDESTMTPEQIAHKQEFERKRRAHYNEGVMMRKMREKAEKHDDED